MHHRKGGGIRIKPKHITEHGNQTPTQSNTMKASNLKALLATLLLTPVVSASAQDKPAQPASDKAMNDISKCPVMGAPAAPGRHTAAGAMTTSDWWPNQLNPKPQTPCKK